MTKRFGFITERNIKTIMDNIFKSVLAEEPPTDPPAGLTPNTDPEPKPTPNINFEDLIAKARKDEKAKLYPQIETLKKENGSLVEKVNAHLLTVEEKDREIERLKAELETVKTNSSKSDDEAIKALKSEIKELKKTIKEFEESKVDLTAFEDKIRGEYEVKLYREQKLREAGEAIIPELVTGFTKEDIDASFEVAKGRYSDIIGKAVSTATSTIPAPNPSTTKFSAKDFKPEDIANMTASEWAEYRKQLGLR